MGARPWMTRSGAGSDGSRKISSVPPDRQGLCTLTMPGSAGSGVGLIFSSTGSPDDRAARAWLRTLASAHSPPTNPTIVPSARTSAASPGLADVGRSARTTVATTKG